MSRIASKPRQGLNRTRHGRLAGGALANELFNGF